MTGKLTLSDKGKLELKNKESLKQTFGNRTKVVKVEVRKTRHILDNDNADNKKNVLTDEKAQKLKILQEAKKREEEENAKKLEQEKLEAIQKAKLAEEKELENQKNPEDKDEAKKEPDAQELAVNATTDGQPPSPEKTRYEVKIKSKTEGFDEEKDDAKNRFKKKAAPANLKKREGKLTVQSVLSDWTDDEKERSITTFKKAKKAKKVQAPISYEKVVREVTIPDTITVAELANRMSEKAANVIKILMKLGIMATINQPIDADTAQLVVEDMGHKFKRISDADVEESIRLKDAPDAIISPRPPVVTVMGHVDHGKTSLLDAIRKTNVVSKEAGGITQHIGAYQVQAPSGEYITFIDTPGHEAFTAMRARGAKVTDIVILVVAADDGIMPQTIEAITHAKAAGVPIIVAINKIDKPGADPSRIKTDLLNHELVIEDMGGDVLCVEVSAKQQLNIDKLLETVLLQAEVLDLKANKDRSCEGIVIEAKMEAGKGAVSTVLIQKGTLNIGDIFVAGKEWGKVRALLNDQGKKIKCAIPSEPVEVLGFVNSPIAGDSFIAVENEAKAREVAEYRARKEKDKENIKKTGSSTEQLFAMIKTGKTKTLAVIIKADVQGSIEAISGALDKLKHEEIRVNIIHGAVGGINESDITLAQASNAFIMGFNVRANTQARALAKRDNIDIRYYSVIYDAVDDIKLLLEGMLSPELKENILGYAEIRQVFNITKTGKVAGCMITEGQVKRGAKVRLLRDNVVIHDGELSQLKRFKDDVREAKEGFECGMSFANYDDIKEGDFIECYEIQEIKKTLG